MKNRKVKTKSLKKFRCRIDEKNMIQIRTPGDDCALQDDTLFDLSRKKILRCCVCVRVGKNRRSFNLINQKNNNNLLAKRK